MKKKVMALIIVGCMLLAGCGEEKVPENLTRPGQVMELALQEIMYEESHTGYSIVFPDWYGGDEGYGFKQYGNDDRETIFITQFSESFGADWVKGLVDISQHKDSTDILEIMLPQVAYELHSGSGSYVNPEYEILFTKEINGVEMTKFKGSLEFESEYSVSDEKWIQNFVAYGIEGRNFPILLIGIDNNSHLDLHGEAGALIPELEEILDKMVLTFKDCPEE